jgi:hypothetical protein
MRHSSPTISTFAALSIALVVSGLACLVACSSSDAPSPGGAADAAARDAAPPVPCSGPDGSCCPEPARVFTGGTCDSDLGGIFCADPCGLTYECDGVSWSTVQGGISTCASDGGASDAAPETGADASADAPDDAPLD